MGQQEEQLKDILLAVDVGYDPKSVAASYVEQFNKVSHFTIIDWDVRNPTTKEIEHAQKHQSLVDKVFKSGEEWFTSYKSNDAEVRKRVFVLMVKRYQRIPQHLYESRMKNLKVEPIEVHRRGDSSD